MGIRGDIMESWIKENSKRKAMRRVKEIVRLKLDEGFTFEAIARMLKLSVEDCKLAFANAVDGVDFASDSLSEDETRSEWGPIPTNTQADGDEVMELTGRTIEILLLTIDEFSRDYPRLRFSMGAIGYNGAEFFVQIYSEGGAE